jgi:hypothetical protein
MLFKSGARIISVVCRPEDATNIASAITALGHSYTRFDGKWGTNDGEYSTVEIRVAAYTQNSAQIMARLEEIRFSGVQFLLYEAEGWML